MAKVYQAKINAKCGGSSILTLVDANDSSSAKKEFEKLWYFKSFAVNPTEATSSTIPVRYKAKIYVNTSSSAVEIIVFANDSFQAKKIIELRPDFKSFSQQPQKI